MILSFCCMRYKHKNKACTWNCALFCWKIGNTAPCMRGHNTSETVRNRGHAKIRGNEFVSQWEHSISIRNYNETGTRCQPAGEMAAWRMVAWPWSRSNDIISHESLSVTLTNSAEGTSAHWSMTLDTSNTRYCTKSLQMTQNTNKTTTNLSPPHCRESRDQITADYWSANMLDANISSKQPVTVQCSFVLHVNWFPFFTYRV